MFRFLIFTLCLFALASCQPEKPNSTAETRPPSQLAVLHQENAPDKISPDKESTPAPAEDSATATLKKTAAFPSTPPPSPVKKAGQPEQSTTTAAASTQPARVPPPTEGPEAAQSTDIAPEMTLPPPPGHDAWNALLRKYVSSTGKVNYKGLLADKAKLQAYLDELATNPVDKSWSRNEKLAYWINAYNAFTVKLILDYYPVSSITKIHGGKPWDVKWIKLGDETYSLNNIENDIIRPQFKEPRIHFAVNCAARSCPPLLNQAWTAGNLNTLLEQQTRSFINNPSFNSISPKAVEISKIFEWYAGDFGNIIEYLNQYSKTSIQEAAKVSYREYDWGLNE